MDKYVIEKYFEEIFNSKISASISCPGRINIIGEHTDYNMGFVMPAAVDKYVHLAFAENSLDHFSFYACNTQTQAKSSDKEGPGWLKYLQFVIHECKDNGLSLKPLNICFGGNLPIGAGMSSSSALTCGFIACLNVSNNWNLNASEMVNLAHRSENRTGLGGGVMDQYSIVKSKANHLLQLNCADMTCDFIPVELGDAHSFLLINSKVSHSLVDSAYRDRKQDCLDVLQKVKQIDSTINTVSEIPDTLLEKINFDEKKVGRVRHVLSENKRVGKVAEAFKTENIESIGPLLNASHISLKNDYEVSCEEIDFLLDKAKSLHGFLGGRIMGGGFGGCCICIIRRDQLEKIKAGLFESYLKRYNLELAFYPVEIVSGVFDRI